MDVLLIIPNSDVRAELREAFGKYGRLRARTYAQGLVLAEQSDVYSVVLWSTPGVSAEVLETISGLRRRVPRAPIVVITPAMLKAGVESMAVVRPRAYLLDSSTGKIVSEALAERSRSRRSASPMGVPIVIVPPPDPTSKKGGSSSADH